MTTLSGLMEHLGTTATGTLQLESQMITEAMKTVLTVIMEIVKNGMIYPAATRKLLFARKVKTQADKI